MNLDNHDHRSIGSLSEKIEMGRDSTHVNIHCNEFRGHYASFETSNKVTRCIVLRGGPPNNVILRHDGLQDLSPADWMVSCPKKNVSVKTPAAEKLMGKTTNLVDCTSNMSKVLAIQHSNRKSSIDIHLGKIFLYAKLRMSDCQV